MLIQTDFTVRFTHQRYASVYLLNCNGLYVWQKLMTATVVIPFGGKQVFKSVESIIDSFENFQKDPKSAVSTVTGNTLT